MKNTVLILAILLPFLGMAQDDNFDRSSVQFSLVGPIGTNGRANTYTVNHLSFNLIYGTAAGVDGAEFGLIANTESGFVKGFQAAGVANIVEGNVNGVQVAGVSNVNLGNTEGVVVSTFANVQAGFVDGVIASGFTNVIGGYAKGVQAAGFVNVVGAEANGVQAAGFVNVTGGSMKGVQGASFVNVVGGSLNGVQGSAFVNVVGENAQGLQGAGFVNVNGGDMEGLQGAGFGNINGGDFRGLQVAGFLNVAGDVKGMQAAAFINVARKVQGVQLGFINISKEMEGVPIGFLSISKNGYHHLDVWGSEALYGNLSYKTGVKKFYNIFSIGWHQDADAYRYAVGYGIGTEFGKSDKGFFGNFDLMAHHINENEAWTDQLNLLGQAKLQFGYRFHKRFGIFAGPTFNGMVSDLEDGSGILPSWSAYDEYENGYRITFWPGFTAGLRI